MKKFIVMIMLLIPLGMSAQEMKIAYVNSSEIYSVMPEVPEMESKMAALKSQYDAALKTLTDDYERKSADLMSQTDSLTDNIRMMRIQEIEEIRTRAENLYQASMQDLDKKQQEWTAPIQEKVRKAIEEVGEENGYTCIIERQFFHYVSKSMIDATEKVKAKLGVK